MGVRSDLGNSEMLSEKIYKVHASEQIPNMTPSISRSGSQPQNGLPTEEVTKKEPNQGLPAN